MGSGIGIRRDCCSIYRKYMFTPTGRHVGANKRLRNAKLPLRPNNRESPTGFVPNTNCSAAEELLGKLTNAKDGLGINMERPKFPQYAVQATRISSFKHWPSYLNQTPELLAEAGFVYGGVADSVRCFFCGGGLRNWDPEDKPWEEHARWYPKCGHVRLCKGDDFIKRINEEDAEEDNFYPDIAVAQSAVKSPEVNIIDGLMKSVPALSVLEWGYDSHKVKKAIETVLSKGKSDFVAKDLMELLMEEVMDTSEPISESFHEPALEQRESTVQCKVDHSEPETTKTQNDSDCNTCAVDVPESDELLEENRRLQEQHLCKICLDERACIVFLPCGHMVSCPQCAPAMRKCPICRSVVKGTVKAYMA